MKKIGFYKNLYKDADLKVTQDLVGYAENQGCKVILFDDEITDIVDFLVVLGGDGTVLRAAKFVIGTDIPLLGINLGNVGYLTDVENSQAKNAIDSVLSGNFKIEERMMLTVNKPDCQFYALNDIVVHRGASPRMIECAVSVDGEHMDAFRADGLIISTPTGSTAYNLAAGGPVLKPDERMVVITPVCPHSPSARPIVVSINESIEAKVAYAPIATISFDGVIENQNDVSDAVGEGFSIVIRPSSHFARIIKTNNSSFYEIFRKKMRKV
ncbi:MAG: NAD(+)/NADH kinase [Defluviitaleaceae bacterium]|nr:NAD(+)/NADH kinase [Defluviitaleaceae bacterium]